MPEHPDPLDPLLNQWKLDQPLPPDALTHEVWRRIADAEVNPAGDTIWGRIEAIFSRPSFNFAFVVACTLFGLFLAEVRVSHRQAERNVQLARAYVQLIDPLLDPAQLGRSKTVANTP